MKNNELYEGRISSNRRGFAFVLGEGRAPDIFVPEREAAKVLHGDLVLIKKIRRRRGDRYFGKILKVIEPGKTKILGRVNFRAGINVFEPIQISIGNFFSVEIPIETTIASSDVLECLIQRDSDGFIKPLLLFSSIIEPQENRRIFVEIAIRNHELPDVWPKEVLQEASSLSDIIDPKIISKRNDMRSLPFVTIDGQDAKDYDDAIFVDKQSDYFDLYVAIADVAEFVKPNSLMDDEARNRGTSVYFSDFVIPMLPENLSNNLCSLKPNVDRLVIVVHSRLDFEGKLIYQEFCEAVIRSHSRLSYDEVQDYYNGNSRKFSAKVAQNLGCQKQLYRILHNLRRKRAALEIDNIELKYQYDHEGKLISIDQTERNESQGVVEECMIYANVAVASFLKKARQNTIYRHHPEPEPEKILNLAQEAAQLNVKSEVYNGNRWLLCNMILDKTDNTDKRHYYSLIVKRSQSLAFYSTAKTTHFGLALESYTHFTSPIRRYCDLMVHRALKAEIRGTKLKNEAGLDLLCSTISRFERRAEFASKDELQYLKCELMSSKLGEEFDGFVTNLSDESVVVQLFSYMIEGFVLGHKKGKNKRINRSGLKLGSPVRLVLSEVDLKVSKIYFKLK